MVPVIAYKTLVDGETVLTFARMVPMEYPPTQGITIVDEDDTEILVLEVSYNVEKEAYFVDAGEVDGDYEMLDTLEMLDDFVGWTLVSTDIIDFDDDDE